MAGAWQSCCCARQEVRQFASSFSHNTFKWLRDYSGLSPTPPDMTKHYQGVRCTEHFLDTSAITEMRFYGLINRCIYKRTYLPDENAVAVAFEDIRVNHPPFTWTTETSTGSNEWFSTSSDRDTGQFILSKRIEGIDLASGAAEIDLTLFNAALAAVDWSSIPPGYTLGNGRVDTNIGASGPYPDFSPARLLSFLQLGLAANYISSVTDGPTSQLTFTCPGIFDVGLGSLTFTEPLDLETLAQQYAVRVFDSGHPRSWGRYRGVISANKVNKTHTRVSYNWVPAFDEFALDDCALTRAFSGETGRICLQPGAIVLPPAIPGAILIPDNPSLYPCP